MPALTAEEIMKRIDAVIDSKRTDYSQKLPERDVNWMSQIGVKCLRRLYYERTAQNMKSMFSIETQLRMIEGNYHEERTKEIVQAAGYSWIRSQQSVRIAHLKINGQVDGFPADPETGNAVLGEAKSMTPPQWSRMTSIEAIDQSKYYAAYLDTLTGYMFGLSHDHSLLFLRNRDSGRIRVLEYSFDSERWKGIEERISYLNDSVDEKVPPDRIEDESYCSGCSFRNHCLPEILEEGGIQFIDSPETAENLRSWMELKEPAREFGALNEWKKAAFHGVKRAVINGEFLVKGMKTGKGWKTEVVRLKGAD